jgi:hypothetical protein
MTGMAVIWQDAIVWAIVAAAIIYLVTRASQVIRRKRAAGCATGCSSCPSGTSREPNVVSLNVPEKTAP